MKFVLRFLSFLFLTQFVQAGDLAEEVLAEINFARTSPGEYAAIVATRTENFRGQEGGHAAREAVRFLAKQRPLAPLASSPGLSSGALLHVLEMGPAGKLGHSGRGGSQPWHRMARFGEWSGSAAENIHYGAGDARAIVVRLIVDDGVRSRGHRKNIFGSGFRVAGAATGFHARYGAMCVINFAGGFRERDGGFASR